MRVVNRRRPPWWGYTLGYTFVLLSLAAFFGISWGVFLGLSSDPQPRALADIVFYSEYLVDAVLGASLLLVVRRPHGRYPTLRRLVTASCLIVFTLIAYDQVARLAPWVMLPTLDKLAPVPVSLIQQLLMPLMMLVILVNVSIVVANLRRRGRWQRSA